MKTAFYMEDGLEQLVFTPETPTEKAMLGKLHDGTRTLEIKQGSFYECRGGWVRQQKSDESTMIVLRVKPPEPAPTPSTTQTWRDPHIEDILKDLPT